MINFNVPPQSKKELSYLSEVLKNKKFSGDGPFTKKCHEWFKNTLKSKYVLSTTSCTHSLEISAILADIQPGDEVIMPSYTFVSTANAFVLRGAKIVFVDIRPDTMNIDEKLIENAITKKTKAIVPVHYAGVSCEMDEILSIAQKYNLLVIEDAAQGVMAKYKGQYLGNIGDMGCYSFHETKNYSCGEGGLLLMKEKNFFEKAEIIREKGTNRSRFFRGQVDKYSWVNMGSSYLPSELNMACLLGQLEIAEKINQQRLYTWNYYYEGLQELQKNGDLILPTIPDGCEHNAHMFYIKVRSLKERSLLIKHLKSLGILAVFHYIPLHSSEAGLRFSRFSGEDIFTTQESEKLLRLPLYYDMKKSDIEKVINGVRCFYP